MIDNAVVITGSFNWTLKAETHNHENITIIHDTMLAKAFYQQFYKIIDKPIPNDEIVLPIAQIIKRLEILKKLCNIGRLGRYYKGKPKIKTI